MRKKSLKKTNPARRTTLLTAALLLALPGAAMAQVSLVTVVDLAQRNSSEVRIAEASERKAEAALAQTRDPILPTLVAASGLPAFPSFGYTGGMPSIFNINVHSMVFNMPQKMYMEAARDGLQSARLSLKDAREQSALEAATSYLELDTLNRELEAARQQEGYATHLVEITQQRAEAGVDPLSELLQTQLTAAQIRLRRIHIEGRLKTVSRQLAILTGLPESTLQTDRASIPEIPKISGEIQPRTLQGAEAARMQAASKQKTALGDSMNFMLPTVSFELQYMRKTTLLNDVDAYFSKPLPVNNLASGFSIVLPIFDWSHRDKGRESSAEALKARVEAEQVQHQNELHIAMLTNSLLELDTLAEIASLKQQIATQQIVAITTQLESGNGATPGPDATPQLSPRAEQQARIDEREKYTEALDASLDLSKTRLSLLRALGHMNDWLNELHAATK